MTTPNLALLPGDGIGPEVTDAAVRVLEAAGLRARWTTHHIGWRLWREQGDPLPPETLAAVRDADAALLGAITSKPQREADAELAPRLQNTGLRYRSPIVRLRRELDLFACLRPAVSLPGVPGARPGVDILTIRENTEGLYAGVEWSGPAAECPWPAARDAAPHTREHPNEPLAISVGVVTEHASERIARVAFQQAADRGAERVILLDKPNILRETGGLFAETAERVAADFPAIELVVENIDAACMRAITHTEAYEVVLAGNLFGDIFSDLTAGLTGGPGLAASANIGAHAAVFEPVHGSAPDIAGKGLANPIACVLAAARLANHIGQPDVAARAEDAVRVVLERGRVRTPDLGGDATTQQMTDALVGALE